MRQTSVQAIFKRRSFFKTTNLLSKPFSKTETTSYPYLSLLDQCSGTREFKPVHVHLIVLGLVRYTYIASRVLAFYASDKGDVNYARQVFDRIPSPTLFNWNVMIRCYSRSCKPEMGLLVFTGLRRQEVVPNMHTFPITIKACAGIFTLSQVHGQVFSFGFDADVFVVSALIRSYSGVGSMELAFQVFDESSNRNVVCWTSLISGYCDSGLVGRAREIFNEMPERNNSSWSAMITGYVQNEQYREAIKLFHEMWACVSPEPNGSLLVSVLNACAGLGASERGRWIHSYLDRGGLGYGLEIGTALVDFYAKIGCIESACEVFGKILHRDVTAWSAMITGFAINGHSQSAIKVFSEMLASGIAPNAITFIGVLSACSHGGLVKEGWDYFEAMRNVYSISPMSEHYGCMVDVLSRAGLIDEAERLIRQMPMEPDAAIWGALLSGCIMHGHKEVGERVGRILVELEPLHAGRYVSLANIYAAMGRWDGVVKVRLMMRHRGVVVAPGWSSIEMDNGSVHRFQVDDRGHSKMPEIYETLKNLKENCNDHVEECSISC